MIEVAVLAEQQNDLRALLRRHIRFSRDAPCVIMSEQIRSDRARLIATGFQISGCNSCACIILFTVVVYFKALQFFVRELPLASNLTV